MSESMPKIILRTSGMRRLDSLLAAEPRSAAMMKGLYCFCELVSGTRTVAEALRRIARRIANAIGGRVDAAAALRGSLRAKLERAIIGVEHGALNIVRRIAVAQAVIRLIAGQREQHHARAGIAGVVERHIHQLVIRRPFFIRLSIRGDIARHSDL